MRYGSDKYHRRTIGLKRSDYSQSDAYFVTVSPQNRECLLGTIVDAEIQLNDAGLVVQMIGDETPTVFRMPCWMYPSSCPIIFMALSF